VPDPPPEHRAIRRISFTAGPVHLTTPSLVD
jgi:hypothetical protein